MLLKTSQIIAFKEDVQLFFWILSFAAGFDHSTQVLLDSHIWKKGVVLEKQSDMPFLGTQVDLFV